MQRAIFATILRYRQLEISKKSGYFAAAFADPRQSLGTSADTHRLGEAGSAHAATVNSSVDAFGQSGTALSGVEPAAAGDPIFGQSLGTRITSLGTSSGAAHHGAAESQEQALAHADDTDGAPDGASDLSDTEWSGAHAAAENLGRKRAYSPRKQPSRQAALNGNTTPLSQKREPKKTRQNHRR